MVDSAPLLCPTSSLCVIRFHVVSSVVQSDTLICHPYLKTMNVRNQWNVKFYVNCLGMLKVNIINFLNFRWLTMNVWPILWQINKLLFFSVKDPIELAHWNLSASCENFLWWTIKFLIKSYTIPCIKHENQYQSSTQRFYNDKNCFHSYDSFI